VSIGLLSLDGDSFTFFFGVFLITGPFSKVSTGKLVGATGSPPALEDTGLNSIKDGFSTTFSPTIGT